MLSLFRPLFKILSVMALGRAMFRGPGAVLRLLTSRWAHRQVRRAL